MIYDDFFAKAFAEAEVIGTRRFRCTTCRVQILDGFSNLSAPTALEERVAVERGWDAFTRLACQTRVSN